MDQEQLEQDIEVYERGRLLRSIVITPAWDVIIDTLRTYKDVAVSDLLSLAPGDVTVPTAHAAAAALTEQFDKFQQDIKNAVDFAAQPSDELRNYLISARDRLDVLKMQGQEN